MLQKIIESQFNYLKNDSPSKAKLVFGKIWAAFASKRVRFYDSEIFLSWRSLSAQLAQIYNSWFNERFTTDAFLKAFNPDTPMGENSEYDEVLMRIIKFPNCLGIYKVRMGPSITVKSNTHAYSEVSILTGEEKFYTQTFKNGRAVGSATQISGDEFERICYASR